MFKDHFFKRLQYLRYKVAHTRSYFRSIMEKRLDYSKSVCLAADVEWSWCCVYTLTWEPALKYFWHNLQTSDMWLVSEQCYNMMTTEDPRMTRTLRGARMRAAGS